MTGIERLRELARICTCDCKVLVEQNKLADIADQIEREARAPFSLVRVLAVVSDMESRVSDEGGSFGALVARWARELRGATMSRQENDAVADASVSAYDLLPADEREAIAWVREHGGLDSVKKLLDWVVGHCSTRQQLDFDFWLSGRVMHELGFEEDMADRDGYLYGKPEDFTHRAPVLAADGKPLEVGQTVYLKTIGKEYIVEEVSQKCVLAKEPDAIESVDFNEFSDHLLLPSQLTHERPDTRARVIDGMDEETVERIDRLVKDGRWLDD